MRRGPLILGGLDATSASVSGVFQLDAGSGAVEEVGALTGPLHDAAAVTLGERILVFGGGTSTSTDTVQSLQATGGAVASGTVARQVGRLPTIRSDLSAVTIGDRAYVLGGYDGSEPIDSVLETTDGSAFTQVATLPTPARYMAVATLGGVIYAFGGESATGEANDAIQAIDPEAETARVVGHMPEPLSHAAAFNLGGQVYIAGGEAGGAPSDAIWRFDPGSARVVRAGGLPVAASGAGAATVGSTEYLIGGTGAGEQPLPTVLTVSLRRTKLESAPNPTTSQASPTAGPSRPFSGRLMIADRGNNRLIVVNAEKKCSGGSRHPPTRRRPAASTFPTTPSSSTVARASSPTRSRTSASSSSPSHPESCSGPTAIRA